MPWIPNDTPYDIRKPGECATFELIAFIGYCKVKLESSLEPNRREWLEDWLRELEAERQERNEKAAEHTKAMKAKYSHSPEG
jgi:hypothetical protein